MMMLLLLMHGDDGGDGDCGCGVQWNSLRELLEEERLGQDLRGGRSSSPLHRRVSERG